MVSIGEMIDLTEHHMFNHSAWIAENGPLYPKDPPISLQQAVNNTHKLSSSAKAYLPLPDMSVHEFLQFTLPSPSHAFNFAKPDAWLSPEMTDTICKFSTDEMDIMVEELTAQMDSTGMDPTAVIAPVAFVVFLEQAACLGEVYTNKDNSVLLIYETKIKERGLNFEQKTVAYEHNFLMNAVKRWLEHLNMGIFTYQRDSLQYKEPSMAKSFPNTSNPCQYSIVSDGDNFLNVGMDENILMVMDVPACDSVSHMSINVHDVPLSEMEQCNEETLMVAEKWQENIHEDAKFDELDRIWRFDEEDKETV
ncbi:hypothetical protein BDQ17DRAFT_1333213 [Cyathus striatus]|nr:hypothetical protein BDQ17DRAFT_1333213 [Cyathus striatus]